MSFTYIIGEIGQNHNGSIDIAKLMIDCVSRPVVEKLFGVKVTGMNAVKLVRRDLDEELSYSQMQQPYLSPHSFGKTYGEHRRHLEFNDEQHHELYCYAKSFGLDFIETLCAIKTLSLLKYFIPDKLKVASRDLTNHPLLEVLAETQIPIILSTGMAGKKELDDALNIITKKHENISILHCVSQYPTEAHNVNLNTIPYLIKNYPKYTIGYSDHTIGLSASVAAVAMGAKIIEKHITIDRKMKGTDQAGSLGPEGIDRLVRDVRILELSMGIEDIFICDAVSSAKQKLERSIASLSTIEKGTILTEDHIHLLSPGNGIKWTDRNMLLGKKVNKTIKKDELILLTDIE